jgi:hypothetical protein
MPRTDRVVSVTVYNFFFFFFYQSTLKHFNFFHFLYHINNFFYYYSNKKFTTIQNFFTFHFFIQIFLLYIISSLFNNFKINNPLLCSIQAFAKQPHYLLIRARGCLSQFEERLYGSVVILSVRILF